ncbi:MATH domain and coiled-coil domain-containing protein [Carex littledalei]|uniref:MATH domain and coiled-coil domain-containing protein n=1 Tax=Carex littledalei TaxID=544730 RepID=A0A833VIU0_9POAL|nr:MATH domain and coiled-coil domain-containing protein [Carex littledalei]
MGSSYSCYVAESKGTKKINHQIEAQKEDSDENKLPMKHTFIWKIDGFKSLLKLGEGCTTSSFNMLGITWTLSVNPTDRKSRCKLSKKHLSLHLGANPSSLSPNFVLETKFKLFIHDQKDGKHIEREVSHTYMTTSRNSRVSCMILLETLKSPSLGFLVNDSIAVGVELIEFKKVPCNGVERTSFIPKNKSSGSFSWYIEDFSQLSRPIALSKPFEIAGYTWKLRLEPESMLNKNYVGLYLKIENKSASQLPSGVMVQAVFSIKRQSQGITADNSLSNKSLYPYQDKFRCNFTDQNGACWGYSRFIRLEDFKNPSNGYLIKGTCTIEASVCIFGSENDRSN